MPKFCVGDKVIVAYEDPAWSSGMFQGRKGVVQEVWSRGAGCQWYLVRWDKPEDSARATEMLEHELERCNTLFDVD